MQKLLLNLAAFAAKILPNSFKQAIYKIKPLAILIRRGLNRASPTGLVQVKVAAGDLAGSTILLDMQIDKDYWLGTYEAELKAALRELVPASVVRRGCQHRLRVAPASKSHQGERKSICFRGTPVQC